MGFVEVLGVKPQKFMSLGSMDGCGRVTPIRIRQLTSQALGEVKRVFKGIYRSSPRGQGQQ